MKFFAHLPAMHEYRLVTHWCLTAPLQAVFDAVLDSLSWPQWWHGAESVVETAPGDPKGIGSVRCYAWRGALPYPLSFRARSTRVEAPCLLEAAVDGDLEGVGRWRFTHDSGITTVCHEWEVRTTRRWMNLLAPLARPLFVRNHRQLMLAGAEGLARRLGVELKKATHDEMTPASGAARSSCDWFAAAMAGIIAGIAATVVQLALWWLASYPLPATLWRDSRLAAAIVLGPIVLPPPPDFALTIVAVASLVHFALSAAYGIVQIALTRALRAAFRPIAGTLFGLLLYVVNMYGFTQVYPWFEVSRDWITATAHATFGLIAALAYDARENYRARRRQV
jgi:hypothetical protein